MFCNDYGYIVRHDLFVDPLLMKDDDEAGVAVSRDTIDEILCRDWGLRCVSSNCDDAGMYYVVFRRTPDR